MKVQAPLYEGLLLQPVIASQEAKIQPRYIPVPPWLIPRKVPGFSNPVRLYLKH